MCSNKLSSVYFSSKCSQLLRASFGAMSWVQQNGSTVTLCVIVTAFCSIEWGFTIILTMLLLLCRLVLLLQLMGTFVEMSCSKAGIANGSSSTSTSVGPIVKKYWSRTLHLCTSLTQTVSQVRLCAMSLFSVFLKTRTLWYIVCHLHYVTELVNAACSHLFLWSLSHYDLQIHLQWIFIRYIDEQHV